jgi:hypothetical protein
VATTRLHRSNAIEALPEADGDRRQSGHEVTTCLICSCLASQGRRRAGSPVGWLQLGGQAAGRMPPTRSAVSTSRPAASRAIVLSRGSLIPRSSREISAMSSPDRFDSSICVSPAASRSRRRFRPNCSFGSTAIHRQRDRPIGLEPIAQVREKPIAPPLGAFVVSLLARRRRDDPHSPTDTSRCSSAKNALRAAHYSVGSCTLTAP